MMPPDDHHDPLEARLRALRPTTLPTDLRDRLLAAEPPPVRHHSLRFLPVTGSLVVLSVVLIAAALAIIWPDRSLVSTIPQPSLARPTAGPPARSTADRVFVPASQRSTLLGVSEGETVAADNGQPVRLVRAVWLDDTTYIGDDLSTMHRRTTRTEVVPVALETL